MGGGAARGRLQVVALPIGADGDLAPRAHSALAAADLIAAEHTGPAMQMMVRYGVATPVTGQLPAGAAAGSDPIREALSAGRTVALIADCGAPCIADPGAQLIAWAHQHGIEVSPLPGPSAVIAALMVSGFRGAPFYFAGFPPRTSAGREAFLRSLQSLHCTLVLFETTRFLRSTLSALADTLGADRAALLASDLTGPRERLARASLGALSTDWRSAPRAPHTLVVSPNDGN